MANRKVYLVTIDNGLEYSDQDWDIVGIYSLDKLDRAREDGIAELGKLDEQWYRAATWEGEEARYPLAEADLQDTRCRQQSLSDSALDSG